MKKYIAFAVIFLCLGAFSWAQGTKTTLFDVVKSQQELEIMKQILSTTLSFVGQNIQRQTGSKQVGTPFGPVVVRDSYRFSNMNAFYLYGQGAVFVVPTSSFRYGNLIGLSEARSRDMAAAERDIAALSREMAAQAAALAGGVSGGVSGGISTGVPTPPPPPAPAQAAQPKQPAAPAPPAKPASQEELRKRVAEAQERVKKVREESEANRAKFLESLGEVKSFLIEALANHGDSLTTVKPNEYITLVLMLDDFGGMTWSVGDATAGGARQEIISVQKSWITDYKAGRLTLDAFKQKAIQYTE